MKVPYKYTGEIIFETIHETMRETLEEGVKSKANLSGANLSKANLSKANLSEANLSLANLSLANLSLANLSWANLSWANLSGANLSKANLSWANLSWANLSWANLSKANLSWANLSWANLSKANLSGAVHPAFATIEKIAIKSLILEQVKDSPQKLNMESWHTCDTVHCEAGWAVTLHPQGKLLEAMLGTSAAAAFIFHVCEDEVPNFSASNEEAMQWLKGEISYKKEPA